MKIMKKSMAFQSPYGIQWTVKAAGQQSLESGPVRELVKDGRWNVPTSERPANWQALNIPEPA